MKMSQCDFQPSHLTGNKCEEEHGNTSSKGQAHYCEKDKKIQCFYFYHRKLISVNNNGFGSEWCFGDD